MLALAAMALPGCEGVAMIVNAIAPEKVKAAYLLADRPTLVLVDDPYNLLGNPALNSAMASRVGFELKENKALTPANVVDPQRVYELQARLGQAFARTPVDDLGRQAGAQQVIHVYIESARVEQVSPETFKPSALARVKVIDAATGERLFPVGDNDFGVSANSPGVPIAVEMTRQAAGAPDDRGRAAMLARAVADELAIKAAQLFFEHLPRQPGEPRGF